jgi:septum formation protein
VALATTAPGPGHGSEGRGTMKLILASESPRRAEILRNAGFRFEVRPANADEAPLPDEPAENYVRRLAEEKAKIAAQSAPLNNQRCVVIGADTTVVVDNEILGKPADAADARRMLRLLSGRTHEVLTGVALVRASGNLHVVDLERTLVFFLPLSDRQIADYIATGEPFGKAGAYGIQGIGGRFISRLEGDYFNVMGLPLSKLWQMLRSLGWAE